MIHLTENPLILKPGCIQASCYFDKDVCDESRWRELGLTLPERLAKAVTKRKAEFFAGRYCVRLALEKMGWSGEHKIEIGEQRAPCWPQGLVGSITHSRGFASAALASNDVLRGIGIDSEALIAEKTADNVRSHILVDSERFEENTGLVESPRQYLTLVFSAKESIFKCLHPQVKQYFDFRDAEVVLDAKRPGRFSFRLLKTLNEEFCAGYHGSGEYALESDFVHTAVLLEW